MLNLLLFLSLLAFCIGSSDRSRRFSTSDDSYVPKTWRMIPRTKQVHPDLLKPPNDITPDDYFRFIPTYVGSAKVGKPLTWKTSCFTTNSATLAINGNNSASLVVTTSDKNHLLCDDTYLLAYVGSLDITFFEIPWWNHNINWEGGWNDAQMFDIQTHGIRVFKFPDGLTASAAEIFETAMMFFGAFIGTHVPNWTAEDNLKFMKDHMNIDMPPRKTTNVVIPKSEFKSGDLLGIIRLDGIDPMLSWGMGSRTGHTATTMWMDGQLWVTESTGKTNYWPMAKGVQKTPFDEWIQIADKADFNVVHIPLSPAVAAAFNATAATEFFKSVENLPYGFHNLFTGWVDTPEDNYPPPLSSHLVMLLAPFGEWLMQKELNLGETFDFITQTLNHRLKTKGLTLEQTYMESYKRGMNFTDFVTMPEQDDWLFENGDGLKNGSSMVCDVFVTRMWKAGGIFGSLTDQFQATEFTDWDAYTLNIFDGHYKRPKQCVDADPEGQFCQLLGKYRLDIPDYNSYAPFPNMRERCPTLPPDYKKPLKC